MSQSYTTANPGSRTVSGSKILKTSYMTHGQKKTSAKEMQVVAIEFLANVHQKI
jgi:hypothetical protein